MASATANAEPADPADEYVPASELGWEFDAMVYAWIYFAEVGGSIDGGDLDANGSLLLTNDSTFALPLHFEARRHRWSIDVDPLPVHISASGTLAGLASSISATALLLDAIVAYRAYDRRVFGDVGAAAGMLHLEPLAGLRYLYLAGVVDPNLLPSISTEIHRFDPLLGARARLALSDRWKVDVRGDFGGFGVGSDFTWGAWANAAWEFGLLGARFDLVLGYKAIYQDHQLGTGGDSLTYLVHGPIVGLNANF